MLCSASKEHQDDKRQNVTSHWGAGPQVPHPCHWSEKWLMKSEHTLQTLPSYRHLGKPYELFLATGGGIFKQSPGGMKAPSRSILRAF